MIYGLNRWIFTCGSSLDDDICFKHCESTGWVNDYDQGGGKSINMAWVLQPFFWQILRIPFSSKIFIFACSRANRLVRAIFGVRYDLLGYLDNASEKNHPLNFLADFWQVCKVLTVFLLG